MSVDKRMAKQLVSDLFRSKRVPFAFQELIRSRFSAEVISVYLASTLRRVCTVRDQLTGILMVLMDINQRQLITQYWQTGQRANLKMQMMPFKV